MSFEGYLIVFVKGKIKILVKAHSNFKKIYAMVIINKYTNKFLYKILAILEEL